MPTQFSVVQWFSLIVFIAASIIQILYIRQAPKYSGFVMPWLLYSLHASIYYFALMIAVYDFPFHGLIEGIDGPMFFQEWSSVVRLHAGFTILILALLQWRHQKIMRGLW
jgi:hypothetical protein